MKKYRSFTRTRALVLLRYRVTRTFLWLGASVLSAALVRGGWSQAFAEKQWNPKSFQYYETTWFDVAFSLLVSGVSLLFCLVSTFIVLGYIFIPNTSKVMLRKHIVRKNQRKAKKRTIARETDGVSNDANRAGEHK
ncbi:hypothetical protein [Vibrio sonorensis]|uniref:hypothetical protein n=1 Tax=Vibrio sonorensis TaxID=1004316 RepID=UPI00111371B2|nr:hypothetical protein [Vibrio sonorensis]